MLVVWKFRQVSERFTRKGLVLRREPVPDLDRTGGAAAGAGRVDLKPGDFAAVRVTAALSANTLRAAPLARCSISTFAEREGKIGAMVSQ